MSDSSGDELATYDPTTPARPLPAKKSTARPARFGGKSNAGPSSKSANGTLKTVPKRANGNARGNSKQAEHIVIGSTSESEPQHDELEDDDNDAVTVAPPLKTVAKKGPGRASDASATNKAKPSAAKGKARADAQPPARSSHSAAREDDVMEVDDARSNEEEERSRKRVRSGPSTKSVKANAGPSWSVKEQDSTAREHSRLAQENEDLRKEMEILKYERDQYSKQAEEALQIRRTEPEQALQEHMALYESMMKNQQLWQDMSKAARSPGNSEIPHFLSRDAADAEKETSEKEVRRLKDVIKEMDTQLTDKDKRITVLETEAKDLRFELTQEIERARTLAARPQSAASARAALKPDSISGNAATISLYEDMTNLLVIGAKAEKSQHPGLDENLFTCLYTHTASDTGAGANASLTFTLREVYERPPGSDPSVPVQNKNELIRRCKYTPHKTEPDCEWFERLEFFREPFLFAWDQLTVFLKSLTDTLATAVNPKGEGEGSDDDDDDDEEAEANKTVEREVILID